MSTDQEHRSEANHLDYLFKANCTTFIILFALNYLTRSSNLNFLTKPFRDLLQVFLPLRRINFNDFTVT